tara:strand:+ start:42 stop:461 length:420 start_codon:yes stop_codon:yes gene_type:complete
MVLVQNLRKTLSNSASKILADLLSVFIRRRAKLILKKPDNSSSTESSPNPLTQENPNTIIATSSADTSEKIIMETDVVMQARDWAIKRIEEMATTESVDQIYDRLAMMDEWYEWFDLDKMDGMDYIVLEDTTQNSESEI